jgi:hypothetical protein
MRHLRPSEVAETLRRGRTVESFLGRGPAADKPSIRYLELRPVGGKIELWVHDLLDCGSEEFTDLVEFEPLDMDAATEPHATFADANDAIAYALQHFGAPTDRWTNVTVCHDDYADYVHADRPARWPVA